MFLTTVRVRRARPATCQEHGVPYVAHLVEVMVNGESIALCTIEESSGRVATVEWRDPQFTAAKIIAAVKPAYQLMQVVGSTVTA